MTSELILIAELSDNQSLLDKNFSKIKTNFDKLKNLDPSDQKRIKSQIQMDLKSCQAIMDTMKLQIQSLKEEENEKKFKDIIAEFKAKHQKFNDDFKKATTETQKSNAIDILTKATGQETVQEVMNKGDLILDESGKAIERMEKKVNDAKDISKNIKSDLQKQIDQLANTRQNLKEIDYSLIRASKVLGKMAKMIATDKFIMAMIIIILILIIIIVVWSSFFDEKKEYGKVDDIFSNKKVIVEKAS